MTRAPADVITGRTAAVSIVGISCAGPAGICPSHPAEPTCPGTDIAVHPGSATWSQRTLSPTEIGRGQVDIASDGDLIDRARYEDACHWATHQRPISAETLRKNLHISTARSRLLVSIIRTERSAEQNAPMAAAGQSASG